VEDSFYRAFEDRFRGSRELIKSRLSIYLPFIEPLKSIYRECNLIDLGCGRGEWLELLESKGFKTHGVDLDDAMLEVCSSEGLSVLKADAIEYLRKLQDESAVIVSAFHLIEHISFESLQILVSEAFRVLKPCGLLILETPNPENLMVSTTEFYLDPTHKRPVPPKLLHFLAEYNKFHRIKVIRLNGPPLAQPDDIKVTDIFFGISPDYAVVAQKGGPEEQLKLFDPAFDKDYGTTIDELAENYAQRDQKLMAYEKNQWAWWENEWNKEKGRAEELSAQIGNIKIELQFANSRIEELNGQNNNLRSELQTSNSKVQELNGQNNNLRSELQTSNSKVEELNGQNNQLQSSADNLKLELKSANTRIEELNGQINHLKSAADSLNGELQIVYASRSWRITRPLRIAFCTVALALRKISRIPQAIQQKALKLRSAALTRMTRFVINHPLLRARIKALVHRVPSHEAKLHESAPPRNQELAMQMPAQETLPISDLTLHSRHIYSDLENAINNGKRRD
jgi:SAM-dependent methyltransferase